MIAVGFATTSLLFATLAPLAENQLADGNTLFSIVRRVGGSIGVGLLGSMIAGATTLDGAIAQLHKAGAALVGVALVAAVAGTFLPDPGAHDRLTRWVAVEVSGQGMISKAIRTAASERSWAVPPISLAPLLAMRIVMTATRARSRSSNVAPGGVLARHSSSL